MIFKVSSNPKCSMILSPHVSAFEDFRIIRIVRGMTASPRAHLYVKNSNNQIFLKLLNCQLTTLTDQYILVKLLDNMVSFNFFFISFVLNFCLFLLVLLFVLIQLKMYSTRKSRKSPSGKKKQIY